MRCFAPLSSLYMLLWSSAPRSLGQVLLLCTLVWFSLDMYVLHNCLRYPDEVPGTGGVSFTSLLRDLGVKDEMSARYVNNNNDKFYTVKQAGTGQKEISHWLGHTRRRADCKTLALAYLNNNNFSHKVCNVKQTKLSTIVHSLFQ